MSIYIGNNEMSSIYIGSSEITSIYVGSSIVYSGGTTPVDTTNYLRFTAQQDNSTVALSKVGSPSGITLEYSMNKVNWNSWDLSAITINSGTTLYVRGDNSTFSNNDSNYYKFAMSGSIAASGSIMTLLDKTDTSRNTSKNYVFDRLFEGCTSLTSSPELPATEITDYCYSRLFSGCTSLTTAPELPATRITAYCYNAMFQNCTSLTTAPALPATNIGGKTMCYNGMFKGCTSLTTAPALPATKLGQSCYQSMFENCTSLTTAPELPATTITTFCYNAMFKGCSSLTSAPVLPAKNLQLYSYNEMFRSCSSLNSVTSYADTISASNCLNNWLNGVAATGTFYNYGTATYSSGVSGIPSGWTEVTQ